MTEFELFHLANELDDCPRCRGFGVIDIFPKGPRITCDRCLGTKVELKSLDIEQKEKV